MPFYVLSRVPPGAPGHAGLARAGSVVGPETIKCASVRPMPRGVRTTSLNHEPHFTALRWCGERLSWSSERPYFSPKRREMGRPRLTRFQEKSRIASVVTEKRHAVARLLCTVGPVVQFDFRRRLHPHTGELN